jgi:hypothetical protein
VLRICLARCNRRKNRTPQKPLRHRHFGVIEKISRAPLCNRAVHVVVRSACSRRDARCGVDARSLALHRAKTLVFLPRCSNPNAVRAIPAGTGRHRHSLRLGGQHGEEAKKDGEGSEKGREEDQAPEEEVSARRASVFDFERRR